MAINKAILIRFEYNTSLLWLQQIMTYVEFRNGVSIFIINIYKFMHIFYKIHYFDTAGPITRSIINWLTCNLDSMEISTVVCYTSLFFWYYSKLT